MVVGAVPARNSVVCVKWVSAVEMLVDVGVRYGAQ